MRRLHRLRQLMGVLARHGFDLYLNRRKQRVDPKTTSEPATERSFERNAPERFTALLEDLGPTFVKFGQVLSSRPDLLPPGFSQALCKLQDHVPAMPAEMALKALEQGLGRPWDKLFAAFDSNPLASASVAQVHRAQTFDGQEVAVKIQRPKVRELILGDLDLLHLVAQLLESLSQGKGIATPARIIEEFEAAFTGELDFEHEAQMMCKFQANSQKSERTYVVPKIFPDLSSRTVLTMEMVRGRSLKDLGTHEDKSAVAKAIIHAAFEQIFVDGVFHADPHPGNLLINDAGKLVLLDFGCVGEISYAMRETLVTLSLAIANRDAQSVARLLYRVSIPNERVSLHRLKDACASLLDRFLKNEASFENIEAAQVLKELLDVASNFHLRLPPEYSLIVRAAVVVEGILRQLDPELNVLKTAGPYVRRLFEEQFTPQDISESAIKGLLRARGWMQELPLTAAQILMDLESGKLQVQIANPKLETLVRNVDDLALTIFLGFLSCGLITGSFLLLHEHTPDFAGIPILAVAGLSVAALLLGAVLARYVLGPGLRKLPWNRWLWGRRRKW